MSRAHWVDFWLFVRKIWLNVIAILAVLVASALFLHAVETWPEASLLNCFANAFDLMTGEAIALPDKWYLEMFTFLLPPLGVVLAAEGVIAATVLFLNKSRRQGEWNAVIASTYQGYIVICGLGQLGSELCDGLRAAGHQVVAVELDEDLATVVTARRQDTPVIIGDMTRPDTLGEANVGRARCVVLCSGDDLANIEAAVAVKELNLQAAVHARVYKKSLADKISDALRYDIKTFSPCATAAQTILAQLNSETPPSEH